METATKKAAGVASPSASAGSGPAATLRQVARRPSRQEAEAAVRTLLAWIGEDPTREGLVDTPKRVVEAYKEYFAGYLDDPAMALDWTFSEAAGYQDIVLMRGIRVESHCEHHIAPFVGVAHVAYLPNKRFAGISKLARVVEILGKRLQTQEALTAQIADAIEQALAPRGVAILIEAEHHCMATRGVRQPGVAVVTSAFTGLFETDVAQRDRFLKLVGA